MTTDQHKYRDIANDCIKLVPNWYQANCGPYAFSLSIDGEEYPFYNLIYNTPNLNNLLVSMNSKITSYVKSSKHIHHLLVREFIQEQFVLEWLGYSSSEVKWDEILFYLHALSRRTYENQHVTMNMIIDVNQNEKGTRIDLDQHQKLLDQLGTSPFTYFRVDPCLKIIGYEEIRWDEIKNSQSYKYLPEFLNPFRSVLRHKEHSVHLTSSGDWIFMDFRGMIASRRKGMWTIYDQDTFKNTITKCVKSYNAGAALYEIAFDLSFKRHGALLVHDPESKVIKKIVNKECILSSGSEQGNSFIADSVRDIGIGESTRALEKKRLLTELASIDGAVIFDNHKILAFGAIIESHPNANGQSGARSTAALSAYHWGGRPIKVSSDGEITLHFESDNGGGKCDAKLEFL